MLGFVLEQGIETKHHYSVRQRLVLVIDLSVLHYLLVWFLNLTSVTDETSTDAQCLTAPRR